MAQVIPLRHFHMWLPDPAALAGSPPATKFVALRWHEFFDEFTPDSFQPRVCQVPTLLEELTLAADDLVREQRSHIHFESVRAEAKQKLAGEVEKKVCSPKQLHLFLTMLKSDEPRFVRDTGKHLIQDGFKETFEKQILNLGSREIPRLLAAVPSEKGNAEQWLDGWATLALHRSYLDRDDKIVFNSVLLGYSVDELLSEISNKLDGRTRLYECVFEVKLSPELTRLSEAERLSALKQIKSVLDKVASPLPDNDLIPGPPDNRVLVHKAITAVGRQAALSQFAEQLQPALNLLSLYRNGQTTQPIRDGWVGRSIRHLSKERLGEGSLQKLHPRKQAADLTINALAEREIVGAVDTGISNALELYHVAMATEDHRVRFLTLWSALECLTQSVDGATTMERVCKLVGPIVTWRRIEKQIRYLTINIKFLRDWAPQLKDTSIPALPNATLTTVAIEDVLEAVTKPKEDARISSLCEHCSSHPLMLWRVKTVWDNFHSAKNLAVDLKNARQRLDWHLGRIYRARNALVHRGDESHVLPALAIHLQYYFSTTISRLLHGIGERKDQNAREAAYRWCCHSDYVLEQLSKQPSALTVADLLPAPDRNSSNPLWTG